VENFSKALVKIESSIRIDIFSINPKFGEKNLSVNKHEFHRIYSFQSLTGFISKIPKLRGFLTMRRIDKVIKEVNENVHEYDVILLHGLWQLNCYIFSKLKTKNILTVGALWGSDFYKRTNEDKLFTAIDLCDLIVIPTEEMTKDVLEIKQITKDKIRNCFFGLAPLSNLFLLQDVSQKKSKKTLGFEEDAFIIICGYNGSPNHQHQKILSVLTAIKAQLPKKTKIVLPITYGGSKEYKEEVKQTLDETGFDYVLYEDFLTDEEIAHLRKATDLMIQIPITDAFSGSLQEHLFAQNMVIAGSWLPYQGLKDRGIYFETIDNVDELKDKLIFVLENFGELQNKIIESNTPDKFKSSLWSECIKDWHSALNEYRLLS
jgi:hypothetical protein